MEILFNGSFPGEAFSEKIKLLKSYSSSLGGISYIRELAQGFEYNGDNLTRASLILYSWGETGRFFFKHKPKFRDGKSFIRYFSFINKPLLQEISCFFSSLLITAKWARQTRGKQRAVIMALTNYLPIMLANMIICKLFKIHFSTYMLDLAADTINWEISRKQSVLKWFFTKIYIKIHSKVQQHFDSYIYIADGIDEIVNVKKRPFLIVEGVFNSGDLHFKSNKKANAIMYAGSLHKKYGIEKILDVFMGIDDPSLQLWICGKGEMENRIREAAEIDGRIVFFGFLPREEALRKECEAKLLINLRDPALKYTKRSLPGKTFEYMLLGTPFFTTKLECYPDNYLEHMFHVESYDTDEIRKALLDVLAKTDDELKNFGQAARRFIVENASGAVQAKKISDFLRTNTEAKS